MALRCRSEQRQLGFGRPFDCLRCVFKVIKRRGRIYVFVAIDGMFYERVVQVWRWVNGVSV